MVSLTTHERHSSVSSIDIINCEGARVEAGRQGSVNCMSNKRVQKGWKQWRWRGAVKLCYMLKVEAA